MITLYILYRIIRKLTKPKRRTVSKVVKRTTTYKVVPIQPRPAAQPKPIRTEQTEKARFRREQAEADIIHLNQVRADLLKAYELAACDGDTERDIKRRISYDNALRSVDKRLSKAEYEARRA